MATLKEIEALTLKFSNARGRLAADVRALQEAIDVAKREYMPAIRRHVAACRDTQAALHSAVEGSPGLFVKPRTVTILGIKVGFQKGKGKIAFDDPERVVALIEKHLPELADALIQQTKTPVKDALLNLSVDELKKIGCRVTGTGDRVLIKDTTSDVDKLVAALLEEDEEVEA